MSNIRQNIIRKGKQIKNQNIEQDFVLESSFQPQLNRINKQSLFKYQSYRQNNKTHQDVQTARKVLRQRINSKRQSIISQNSQYDSNQLESVKRNSFYSNYQHPTPPYRVKQNLIQLDRQSSQLEKENNFHSVNLDTTVKQIHLINSLNDSHKMFQNEKIINFRLKQEMQVLRAQIYQLRNAQIQLQRSKIYVRKLQTQIQDQISIIQSKISQNQILSQSIINLQAKLTEQIKRSTCYQRQILEINMKIDEMTNQCRSREQCIKVERQEVDLYIKNLQRDIFDKQKQLGEVYGQNKKISLLLKESNNQKKILSDDYEKNQKNMKQLQQIIMKQQQAIMNNNDQSIKREQKWLIQVKRYEILSKQLQKVIEDKCRQKFIIQTQLNNVIKQFQQFKITQQQQNQKYKLQMQSLKLQFNHLTQEYHKVLIIKQSTIIKQQQDVRGYVPKRWFQEKIQYQYKINQLQNKLDNIRDNNIVEYKDKDKDKCINMRNKLLQQIPQQILLASHQKTLTQQIQVQTIQWINNVEEYKTKINCQEKIIQHQQRRIEQIKQIQQKYVKQINQLKQRQILKIEQVEQQYQHRIEQIKQNFDKQMIQRKQNNQYLNKRYKQISYQLQKQKQINEDLTMSNLLLNQQLQQYKTIIKHKQYI